MADDIPGRVGDTFETRMPGGPLPAPRDPRRVPKLREIERGGGEDRDGRRPGG